MKNELLMIKGFYYRNRLHVELMAGIFYRQMEYSHLPNGIDMKSLLRFIFPETFAYININIITRG